MKAGAGQKFRNNSEIYPPAALRLPWGTFQLPNSSIKKPYPPPPPPPSHSHSHTFQNSPGARLGRQPPPHFASLLRASHYRARRSPLLPSSVSHVDSSSASLQSRSAVTTVPSRAPPAHTRQPCRPPAAVPCRAPTTPSSLSRPSRTHVSAPHLSSLPVPVASLHPWFSPVGGIDPGLGVRPVPLQKMELVHPELPLATLRLRIPRHLLH